MHILSISLSLVPTSHLPLTLFLSSYPFNHALTHELILLPSLVLTRSLPNRNRPQPSLYPPNTIHLHNCIPSLYRFVSCLIHARRSILYSPLVVRLCVDPFPGLSHLYLSPEFLHCIGVCLTLFRLIGVLTYVLYYLIGQLVCN